MSAQPTLSPAEAYQGYDGPALFERLASVLLDHARPAPGESVLDMACGTGIVTRRAAAATAVWQSLGHHPLYAALADAELPKASIVARFVDPDRFVERLEFAYAAVVPAFAEDASAFASYLDAVTERTRDVVESYRDGDHVAVPMHTNVAIAYA